MTEQPGTSEQPQKLVVAGQSYVGLPLAIAGVEAGYDIVRIDLERSRVDRLSRGDSTLTTSTAPGCAQRSAPAGSR